MKGSVRKRGNSWSYCFDLGMIDGKRKWVTYNTLDVDDSDFIKLGEEYDKENNVKIYKIGNADVRFIKVRNFVDWAVEWMNKNR